MKNKKNNISKIVKNIEKHLAEYKKSDKKLETTTSIKLKNTRDKILAKNIEDLASIEIDGLSDIKVFDKYGSKPVYKFMAKYNNKKVVGIIKSLYIPRMYNINDDDLVNLSLIPKKLLSGASKIPKTKTGVTDLIFDFFRNDINDIKELSDFILETKHIMLFEFIEGLNATDKDFKIITKSIESINKQFKDKGLFITINYSLQNFTKDGKHFDLDDYSGAYFYNNTLGTDTTKYTLDDTFINVYKQLVKDINYDESEYLEFDGKDYYLPSRNSRPRIKIEESFKDTKIFNVFDTAFDII